MKVQVWNILVCDSIMDSIHGGNYYVKEVYIPELRLAINKKACFIVDESYQRHVTKEGQAELLNEIDMTDDQVTSSTKLAKAIAEQTSSESLARQTFFDVWE